MTLIVLAYVVIAWISFLAILLGIVTLKTSKVSDNAIRCRGRMIIEERIWSMNDDPAAIGLDDGDGALLDEQHVRAQRQLASRGLQ